MDTVDSSIHYILRRAIAERRCEQVYCLSMLRDAALIAALQVTDVRLRRVEKKDTGGSSLSDVLSDVAIAACFGIAGPVVIRGLKVVFDGILRTRLGFAILPKSDLGLWFNTQLSEEAKMRFGNRQTVIDQLYHKDMPFGPAERANLKDFLRPLVRVREAEFNMFKTGFLSEQDPRLLFHESTFKVVDAVVAAAPDATTIPDTKELVRMAEKILTPVSPAGVDARDMATVRVLRGANEFFTRQIASQMRILDLLDIEVQSGGYTTDEAKAMLPFIVDDPTFSELRDVDIWVRFFEFSMWVGLYPDIGPEPYTLKGVPTELVDYLIQRLYVRDKPDPDLGRPLTFLEQAMQRNRNNQDTVAKWRASRGLNLIPQSVLDANRKAAIKLLGDDWRTISTEFEGGLSKLYPRLTVEANPHLQVPAR